MAIASFIKFNFVDTTGKFKSLATIDVDGTIVQVDFWSELIEQWGKEDVKKYLCAEALWKTFNYVDANNLIKIDAVGDLIIDNDLIVSDSRNWQQNWLDNHKVKLYIEIENEEM